MNKPLLIKERQVMKIRIIPLIALFLLSTVNLDAKNPIFTEKDAENALNFAARQYSILMEKLPYRRLPRTIDKEKNSLVTTKSWSWTSGFYPGSLWYLYEHTNNGKFKTEAIQKTMLIEPEKYNTGTHDLGFMLYCSFGNGYKFTGNSNYKDIMVTASNSLISRFNGSVGLIKSWDNPRWQFPVIVDNMMNLELLFWTSEVTNNQKYRNIAVSHANKTMQHHYREDGSVYHVLDFSPQTGEVLEKTTAQGYSDESSWARGQSWGLYGYALTYRETGNEKYLDHAKKIADFLIHHPRLPEDKVPYWDYDAPKIPNAHRDASAGAIMASALIELSRYVEKDLSKEYLQTAKTILNTLSSDKFRARLGQNGGFILKHSVGSKPADSEVNVPLVYADYYYIEALLRFMHLQ
jgi:rhamnogalacturonyl hydrolase YesR